MKLDLIDLFDKCRIKESIFKTGSKIAKGDLLKSFKRLLNKIKEGKENNKACTHCERQFSGKLKPPKQKGPLLKKKASGEKTQTDIIMFYCNHQFHMQCYEELHQKKWGENKTTRCPICETLPKRKTKKDKNKKTSTK